MKKLLNNFVIVSLTVYGVLFFSAPTVSAAGNLKIGEAEIVPWGEVKMQYDDNIYLSSHDTEDDFITTVTPGVSVEWPFHANLLKLDYHVDINRFWDNTSQDATNHYFLGEVEINLREVSFNLTHDFKHVFERPSTEDTSRVKREDNRTGIKAKLEKARLGIELGYEHFIRNYCSEDEYDVYDRKEDTYSVTLTHQTFPKTKLLLEYDFTEIRYDEAAQSDSDYHQLLVGGIGELTPKTTITAKTGYQLRNYDQPEEPDFDSGVLYADITHRFSDKNAVKLSFLRTAEESTYGINNYYKVESVSAVFDHYFSTKLLGFITGIAQVNSYPNETVEEGEAKTRKDKYYSLGAGLRYYLRENFTLTLQAEHIERDSNFDIYEYGQNLITLTGRARF